MNDLNEATTIDRTQLTLALKNGRPPAVFEVLDEPYYRSGHLPGALAMPPSRVLEVARARLADPEQDVVVYCASATCKNSDVAARVLRSHGYGKVRVYAGGKADWIEAGLPLEKGAELAQLQAQEADGAWLTLIRRLIATDSSRMRFFQRAALAGVIFPHGVQKLTGALGGWGFQGTVEWFAQALHVPTPLAVLVVLSDFFGALALFFGIFSRFTAFGIAATMLGATLLWHAPNGFFMNWSGAQAGEGFEFHLLAIALSLPLIVRGGGAWSVDGWLARRIHS